MLKKAQQTIYHTRLYPSHVLLPVIPESTATAEGLAGIDFGELRVAVWCEEKPSRPRQGPHVSGAVAKW